MICSILNLIYHDCRVSTKRKYTFKKRLSTQHLGEQDKFSQGNYLVKCQHHFTYISAHCRLHKRFKCPISAKTFIFGQFGKSLICAYISTTFDAWPSGCPECNFIECHILQTIKGQKEKYSCNTRSFWPEVFLLLPLSSKHFWCSVTFVFYTFFWYPL